jgi:hypothetical protein
VAVRTSDCGWVNGCGRYPRDGMDERRVRNLVKGWHQRSRIEGDLTTKFVFLWFCFNAWLAFESNEDTDREMINWLKDPRAAGSQLRSSFKLAAGSTVFSGHLKALAGYSPISSTGRRQRVVQIGSAEDFPDVVEGIYQVRCNLFHGGKEPGNPRDDKLVRVCALILEKWVGNLVASWRSSS